jgi:hypothetical protein
MTESDNRKVPIPRFVKECGLYISVSERHVITVDLSSVSLPSSPNCENYIEVINGDSDDSIVILKYCGSGTSIVTSSVPNVVIKWHFKHSPTSSPGGISLSTKAAPAIPNKRCGALVHRYPGTMQFAYKGFPQLSRYGGSCSWLLVAPSGKKIDVRFLYSDVRSLSGNCNDNFIQVWDGLSPRNPLIEKICKPRSEIHLVSTGRFMRIMLKVSDAHKTWRGVHVEFNLI